MKYFFNIFLSVLLSLYIFLPPSPKKTVAAEDFIKWVDFNASADMIEKAYDTDIKTFNSERHITMAQVLAYISLKNGNKFNFKRDRAAYKKLTEDLASKSIDELAGQNKYYKYYLEVYNTVFRQYLGVREDGSYGLKTFFPLAAGFWYRESDDFGNSRAYGFKRRHLGHDFFAGTGTPVIALESGTVTELGWNMYGGWRVGITSSDNMRYYYYAHLRKGSPYHSDVKKGEPIESGQVIGYVGATGYSKKPDKNMASKPHMHFGLQLIFHESQIDGNGEIWIDVYQLCKFLAKHNRVKAIKDPETGDYNTEHNTEHNTESSNSYPLDTIM